MKFAVFNTIHIPNTGGFPAVIALGKDAGLEVTAYSGNPGENYKPVPATCA
jgi:hypothetical protein